MNIVYNMPEPSQHQKPVVDVTLARQTCRAGGIVVGTIRVTHGTTDPPAGSPRVLVESLQISAAGFCRLDPRWHKIKDKKSDNEKLPEDLPLPPHTTPFWTAGTVELMDLKERTVGRWEDARPKPIILPGRKAHEKKAILRATLSDEVVALEEHQLAFSFRVDLPNDAPHSLVATSCRYYYLIVVRLQTVNDEEPEWIQVPVTVLTADPDRCRDDSYKSAPLQAVAHASGLPTQLTATELNQFDGQYTVNRQGSALYRNVRGVQSMRVEDPNSGRPACVLTIIGSPSQLHPGSRLTLKLDFPRMVQDESWIPCYQASACLQGEEVAISGKGTRKRARRHLFSTAHEQIDHTTECVPLNLLLPETAPCTVTTAAVDISVQCLVDIAVGTTKGDGFRNLRLEIPCHVVHAVSDWERKGEDECEDSLGARVFQELFESRIERSSDPTDSSSFRSNDIQDELKILSLLMADTCGLRPEPSGY
jgi:hypothetical protein